MTGRLMPQASYEPALSQAEHDTLAALTDDQKLAVAHAIRVAVVAERAGADAPAVPALADADITLAAAALTETLRAWLRARPDLPEEQAAAMAWELAAIVALHSETVAQAYDLLDAWIETMKEQIAAYGVGVEHP